MRDWIRRSLTKVTVIQGKRAKRVEIPPSEKLVYGVYFAIIALLSLTALEIAHMVVVKSFSSEIFAAITLVIGTILGAFFGVKTQ
jgi:uncharacterized protein YqgC (DUF456 family)